MAEDSFIRPTLLFFGNTPDISNEKSLASSLQKIETCFMLIALSRYPSALSESVAAIESVLDSSGVPSLASKKGLERKFLDAEKQYEVLKQVAICDLNCLRITRNKFEHMGFSPEDDSEAVKLLLDVAFPYLQLCYREIHSFGLLSNLILDISNQWLKAGTVRRALTARDADLSFCLNAFGHYLRYTFDAFFSTTSDFSSAFEDSDEHFSLMQDRKALLLRKSRCGWTFDCPICNMPDFLVCDLDSTKLGQQEIKGTRMACANCRFVVPWEHHIVCDVLMREQFADKRREILTDYGIIGSHPRH